MLCKSLHELNTDLADKNARARAVDLLEIMARWLRMGGFPPKLEKGHWFSLMGTFLPFEIITYAI